MEALKDVSFEIDGKGSLALGWAGVQRAGAAALGSRSLHPMKVIQMLQHLPHADLLAQLGEINP